ncbi:MAG TPA: cytochrome c oxidase subunit II [Bellilinea sp.]|nr:cytochrome c oxidase subunit II [Bellilinea sp.]
MLRKFGVLVSLAFLLSSCQTSPTFLNPASTTASHEARLYWIILVMALVVFVLVEGGLLWTVIRDRKRPEDIAPAPQFHGNTRLEVTWTVIPILLVIVLFVMTVQTMSAVAQPEAQTDDLNVRIVGHRWWWEYDYPDLGIVTANELHIPVGKVVQVSLESVDVIHSFWVPQLSGKTDVIPGQHNTMWLKGDKVGVYTGQCAEFCGTEHALMRIHVFVDSQADYDAWVANQLRAATQPQSEDELAGYDTVANTCVSCHSINVGEVTDNAKSGPNLTHLFSRTTFAGGTYPLNEENLRRWLEDTQELKPDSNMQITLLPEEIDQIIAFLTLLK